MAAKQDQRTSGENLCLGQCIVVARGAQQRRNQIVLRMRLIAAQQATEIIYERVHAGGCAIISAAILKSGGDNRRDLLAPMIELFAIGYGNAEHFGNNDRGKLDGEDLDQVELAILRDLRQELVAQLLDARSDR